MPNKRIVIFVNFFPKNSPKSPKFLESRQPLFNLPVYRRQDRLKAFHCYQRHNSFSPFADTIFRKTHLDLRIWFYAISLSINGRKGISSLQLARQLGVSMATGWRMPQQLRKAMDDTDMATLFGAIVEVMKPMSAASPGRAMRY
jgi:hypothetical protein